jgi:hypothetical protein
MIRVAGSFIYERVPSRLADVEMGPVDDAGMSRQAGFEVLPLRVYLSIRSSGDAAPRRGRVG